MAIMMATVEEITSERVDALFSPAEPIVQTARLKILVISEHANFLKQISYIFSPEFILNRKAIIKICFSLYEAIHEVESNDYHMIIMEESLNMVGGLQFVDFNRTEESLSRRAKVITIGKELNFLKKIDMAIC